MHEQMGLFYLLTTLYQEFLLQSFSHSNADNVMSLDCLSLPPGLLPNRPHVTVPLPFHADVFRSFPERLWDWVPPRRLKRLNPEWITENLCLEGDA